MARATGPRGADLPKHTDIPNTILSRTGRTVGSTAGPSIPPRTDPGKLSFEPEATPQRRGADRGAKPFETPAEPPPPARFSVDADDDDAPTPRR